MIDEMMGAGRSAFKRSQIRDMSKIAFIFPGQGAQKAGMGKDFYEETSTGREVFDRASELLGFSMPELCFAENDRLDITEYTQAAMVTTSIAMMKVLMEETGIRPDVAAGLSLGEYCALYAAGVMSADDAITTVRQRGILMQEAVPVGVGAMAAVLAMAAEKIEEVLKDIPDVWIANYNCPGQIVISGKKEAVELACEKLKEAGAKRTVMLNVSRTLPLRNACGSRGEAGRIPGERGDQRSADPLRGQCDGFLRDGQGRGEEPFGQTGFLLRALGAERESDAGGRRGHLC